MEDLKKNGFFLCEEDCRYEGIDLKNFQIRCFCPIKIANRTFNEGFKDMKKWNNFKVLKCYKLLLSDKGQKYNYFSEILIFIFIICLINSILTEIEINNGKFNDLLLYLRNFINNHFENNATYNIIKTKFNIITILKNELNTSGKKQIKNKLVNREENKLNIIFQFLGKKNNYYNLKMKANLIKKESDEFYICLILSIKKGEYQNYLIENELNNLDYIYYREIEDRKWYNIIWSIFKLNSDFLSTFFIFNSNKKYREYRLYSIKVIAYFNSLLLSLFANISFYHNETMHKIYEENGKYNFQYKLPFIILSDIISILASYLFDKLIDNQDELIELKINIYNNKKEEQAKYINKKFTRNRIIFYIISFILQIFIWYFISCFFSVYINTQIYLFIDFLIGLLLSLANLILRTIIIFLFKIIAIKSKSNYNKFLHCILKIINEYKILSMIFECFIEGILMLIFKR